MVKVSSWMELYIFSSSCANRKEEINESDIITAIFKLFFKSVDVIAV